MSLFRLKVYFRQLFGERFWHFLRGFSLAPRHVIERECLRETGMVVSGGPFKGLRYVEDTVCGGYVPKLLGTYERELHETILNAARLDFERIINIGAADGYYAVGLARLIPNARVVVFEMEEKGRALVSAMAERNGVMDRFQILGTCEPLGLLTALATPGRTLVICDVEGYEDVLMNPSSCPALATAHILVELHDGKNAGVSGRVRDRFVATHMITTLWQQERTAAEFPISTTYTRRVNPRHLAAAIDEGRPVNEAKAPRMSWFWMEPKILSR
jgi:hypothetical protein